MSGFEPDCPVLGRLVRLKISARTGHRYTDIYTCTQIQTVTFWLPGNRSSVRFFQRADLAVTCKFVGLKIFECSLYRTKKTASDFCIGLIWLYCNVLTTLVQWNLSIKCKVICIWRLSLFWPRHYHPFLKCGQRILATPHQKTGGDCQDDWTESHGWPQAPQLDTETLIWLRTDCYGDYWLWVALCTPNGASNGGDDVTDSVLIYTVHQTMVIEAK